MPRPTANTGRRARETCHGARRPAATPSRPARRTTPTGAGTASTAPHRPCRVAKAAARRDGDPNVVRPPTPVGHSPRRRTGKRVPPSRHRGFRTTRRRTFSPGPHHPRFHLAPDVSPEAGTDPTGTRLPQRCPACAPATDFADHHRVTPTSPTVPPATATRADPLRPRTRTPYPARGRTPRTVGQPTDNSGYTRTALFQEGR